MAEMKVFVINLDEQEKDTGCLFVRTSGKIVEAVFLFIHIHINEAPLHA